MPVGLMNGSKRARSVQSIANNTEIFGIMGGRIPTVGVNTNNRFAQQNRGSTTNPVPYPINLHPKASKEYMAKNNLLSVNPQGSGGIGKMFMRFA
jgi:hypothetical protein